MRDVRADFETGLAEFNEKAATSACWLASRPRSPVPARQLPQGMSSRRMRQEFPGLRRHYRRANRLWSASYLAGSACGAPISALRQYTEQQNRPV